MVISLEEKIKRNFNVYTVKYYGKYSLIEGENLKIKIPGIPRYISKNFIVVKGYPSSYSLSLIKEGRIAYERSKGRNETIVILNDKVHEIVHSYKRSKTARIIKIRYTAYKLENEILRAEKSIENEFYVDKNSLTKGILYLDLEKLPEIYYIIYFLRAKEYLGIRISNDIEEYNITMNHEIDEILRTINGTIITIQIFKYENIIVLNKILSHKILSIIFDREKKMFEYPNTLIFPKNI